LDHLGALGSAEAAVAQERSKIHSAKVFQLPQKPGAAGDMPALPDGSVLVNQRNARAERIGWSWPGHLGRGEITMLAGEGGEGKSQLALAIGASIAKGVALPGGRAGPGEPVIVLSAEDSIGHTLIPRWLACEAPKDKLYLVKSSFDMQRDLDALVAEANVIGRVGLIVVDPITAYMSSKFDSHKTVDVRGWLRPIQEAVTALNCPALLVAHFNKNVSGARFMHRISGSAAWVQAVRIALVAGREPNLGRRLLMRVKNNLSGKDSGGFEYCINSHVIEGDIETSRAELGGEVTESAEELLGERKGLRRNTLQAKVAAWLRLFLMATGPTPRSEVYIHCEAIFGKGEVSLGTLKKAAEELNVAMGLGRNSLWELQVIDSNRRDLF